jgi:hypothetical protein
MRISTATLFLAGCWLVPQAGFAADPPAGRPVIDLVNMGGNDCPPCVAWRKTDLPKLQAMPEWQAVRYTHVTKSVKSAVPPALFFPSQVQALQPILKEASNGISGSPQWAVLVDGKLVDYWFGTGKAEPAELASMVRAIQRGKPLPRPTCVQLQTSRVCKTPGPGTVKAS